MIVKPDVGWRGFGVRKVRDEDELGEYLGCLPERHAGRASGIRALGR